ncbi:MAG: DNA methyltransferase [Mesorhizobium sp.]|nr:MAG: DNA methyltransferase [Mesorhizobium sp.]
MSQLLVQQYLNEIDRLRKFSGSFTEGVISEAFKDLLKAWARQHNLHFISQYEFLSPQKNRIRPDGTILHDLRVPLGYWEAKDTADDLDEEIRKKLAKGYPQDNIIFENSDTAVLIQNRQEVFRCSMTETEKLLKLVALFFKYEREEIRDFRKAVEQFKHDIPAVLAALRERIDNAYDRTLDFRAAADKFLQHAKDTINPSVGEADVREMLIQHILTEEIFAHVFDNSDFHRENNIAKELYALEAKFFTGQIKRETLKSLETYYATIRANAALISSHQEKQQFLKLIYENFYKVYDKKKADRLGVVYTPNEIVKFMIEGADWLTQKHFGRQLIDEHVEILDPATGTGTFICELLEHFRGQPRKLAHKYKNELHANEVAILPYYVANLNIEATYAAISGQFAEFPNLCFVDTLDNVAGLGIRAGYQHDMFAGLSDENVARVRRQNKRKISVIIGNPPYNANQANENDNNKNRDYPRIDQLIKSSYIRLSTAQKTKVYDMYARFFRWASDRMADDGVLAFITNRSFIESRTFDGFRKAVALEFNEIHVVDLGGDVRANPKLSGTKNNVFGIQTGVAISFFVKRHKQKGCKIFYARRPEFDTAEDKLAFLSNTPASAVSFQRIEPDKNANWVNLTENDWDEMIPVADKKTKASKTKAQEKAIFRQFGNGVNTARDQWVTDPSAEILRQKAALALTLYGQALSAEDEFPKTLKWSRNLKGKARAKKLEKFSQSFISDYEYRPFYSVSAYLSPLLIDEFGFLVQQKGEKNIHIAFPNGGEFRCLASTRALDFHFIGDSRVVSRYRYSKSGERVDNITNWALREFQKAYGKDGRAPPSPLVVGDGAEQRKVDEGYVGAPLGHSPSGPSDRLLPRKEGKKGRPREATALTKDDIFHYVYGVLHDPVYREKYALNLKREFPRIPFYPDFWRWAEWGKRLIELHVGYETVEPWPLERLDTPDEKARSAGVVPKAMLKADRDNGIIKLDTETQLSGIPKEAWNYRLGNRSGLDWVLDQYKEKMPKDPTIREKFNTYRFADYKEKVVDLLMRVTRVSVGSVAIAEAMKAARR